MNTDRDRKFRLHPQQLESAEIKCRRLSNVGDKSLEASCSVWQLFFTAEIAEVVERQSSAISAYSLLKLDFLNRGQRLIEVGNDVVEVLYADGNANHAIGYAYRLSPLLAEGHVSHGCGMGDERLHAAK